MYYTIYKIDDINKIIYIKRQDDIISNDMLLSFINDYERIVKFANENNYIIELYEKRENYEDVFSLKKHL